MSHAVRLHDSTGIAITNGSGQALFAYATTAASVASIPGYAPGCVLVATTTAQSYTNTGTAASSTWTANT